MLQTFKLLPSEPGQVVEENNALPSAENATALICSFPMAGQADRSFSFSPFTKSHTQIPCAEPAQARFRPLGERSIVWNTQPPRPSSILSLPDQLPQLSIFYS